MHNRGIIIPKIRIPAALGGGTGDALSFRMPPEYHILQYRTPFYFNGIIFWFEEVPLTLRRERCAQLNIEGRSRTREIITGIPFYIRRGGFTILLRTIGVADFHVVRQTGCY